MSEALKQFRAQYPMYDDMPDDVLASNIHKTFYDDMSVDDFNAKLFGSKESAATDIGASFVEGAHQLGGSAMIAPQIAGDYLRSATEDSALGKVGDWIADTPLGKVGSAIEAGKGLLFQKGLGLFKQGKAYADENHTDEFKRVEQARPKGEANLGDIFTTDGAKFKQAVGENWQDVKNVAQFYADNGLHLGADIAQSAPAMATGMGLAGMAGKGMVATGLALGTEGISEGGNAAYQVGEKIAKMSHEDLSLNSDAYNQYFMKTGSQDQAKALVARDAMAQAGVHTAGITMAMGKLFGTGKFEADIATGNKAGGMIDLIKDGVKREAPQEAFQSMGGEAAQNEAIRYNADDTQKIGAGLASAGTQGFIAGGAMGAGLGAGRGLINNFTGNVPEKAKTPWPTLGDNNDNRPDVTGKDGTDLIGNQGNSPVIDTHLKRTQDELKAFEQQETEAINAGLAQAVQNAQAASVQNQQAAAQAMQSPEVLQAENTLNNLMPQDPELQALAASGAPVIEITPPESRSDQENIINKNNVLSDVGDIDVVNNQIIVKPKTKPEPVTPFDEVAEDVETPEQNGFKGLPIQELPVDKLTLSNDVPQFKDGANDAGVVEPLGGKFDRTGVAPIQVWQRNDGRMEVISGRHRLDLARRSGESTIPVQVHREADGFDADKASTLDAELNIRDGQGKVADYVQYFTKSGIDKETANNRGLLSRAIGKRAYTIATGGEAELIAAHRANVATDLGAYTIATAFPNDGKRQQVALARLQQGDNVEKAVNVARALSAITGGDSNMDMFGFDDAAIKEAERMAKEAVSIQRRISEDIAAVQGAAKNPKAAAKFGVNVSDPDGVKKRIESLKEERAQWDNWHTNPALVAQLRGEEVQAVEPIKQTQPSTAQDDFLTSYDESTIQAQEANAKALAQQQAAQQNKEEIDTGVDNFSLDMGNVPDDDGGATFDMFSAPEPVAQPKPTQSPAVVEAVTPTYDTIADTQEIVPSKSGKPFKTIAAAKLSATFKNTPNAEIKQVGDKQFVVVKANQEAVTQKVESQAQPKFEADIKQANQESYEQIKSEMLNNGWEVDGDKLKKTIQTDNKGELSDGSRVVYASHKNGAVQLEYGFNSQQVPFNTYNNDPLKTIADVERRMTKMVPDAKQDKTATASKADKPKSTEQAEAEAMIAEVEQVQPLSKYHALLGRKDVSDKLTQYGIHNAYEDAELRQLLDDVEQIYADFKRDGKYPYNNDIYAEAVKRGLISQEELDKKDTSNGYTAPSLASMLIYDAKKTIDFFAEKQKKEEAKGKLLKLIGYNFGQIQASDGQKPIKLSAFTLTSIDENGNAIVNATNGNKKLSLVFSPDSIERVVTKSEELGLKTRNPFKEIVEAQPRGADGEIKFSRGKHIQLPSKLDRTIDNIYARTAFSSQEITIGRTPNVLIELGAEQLPLSITPNKIIDIRNNHSDLTSDNLKQAIREIHDPVAVLKSKTDGLIVVTEVVDAKNNPVIAAVHLQKRKGRYEVNSVASVYGKEKLAQLVETSEIVYFDDTVNDPSQTRSNSAKGGIHSLMSGKNVLKKSDIVNKYGDVMFSFAGTKAKTANLDNLANAEARIAAGEDAETVRQETGWHKGVDGKWRFEIDDSKAKLKITVLNADEVNEHQSKIENLNNALAGIMAREDLTSIEKQRAKSNADVRLKMLESSAPIKRIEKALTKRVRTIAELLDHSDLLSAYPSVGDIKVAYSDDAIGRKQAEGEYGSYNPETNEIRLNVNLDEKEILSTLMHEIQHAIQEEENFARGGSLSTLSPEQRQAAINEIEQEAMNMGLPSYERKLNDYVTGKITEDEYNDYLWDVASATKEYGMAGYKFELYQRLAGETEARNTQKRLGMNAQERKLTAPSATQDVPNDKQIVHFDGGRAEMATPEIEEKLKADAAEYRESDGTLEDWVRDFGDGYVNTPVGTYKMGENQYEKLALHKRLGQLGLVKPTLENPSYVVKDDKDGTLFVRAFYKTGSDGKKSFKGFVSVSFNIEGIDVVVSNHIKGIGKISDIVNLGDVIYQTERLSRHTDSSYAKDSMNYTATDGVLDKNTTTTNLTKQQVNEDDRTNIGINSDNADIRQLAAAVGKYTGRGDADIREAGKLDDSTTLNAVSGAFGKRVVVFETFGLDTWFQGAVLEKNQDAIYISANSTEPAMAVLGHEMMHQIRAENPELYKQAIDAVRPLFNERAQERMTEVNAQSERDSGKTMTRNELEEEMLADVFGDNFMNQSFWAAVARNMDEQNKGAFGKFIAKVRAFLRNAYARLSPFGTDKMLNDVKAAEEVLAKLATMHLSARTGNQTNAAKLADMAAQFSVASDKPTQAEIAQAQRDLDTQLAIADKVIADNGYLTAPNGEKSNLNKQQWAQVRTPQFKAWFGDWENDAANASKVVDANGEPMVVYHGTASDFDVFNRFANWFSSDKQFADGYAMMRGGYSGFGEVNYHAYLNIKNAFNGDALSKTETIGGLFTTLLEQANSNGTSFDHDYARSLLDKIRNAAKREESGKYYRSYDFWFENKSYFGEDGSKALKEAFRLFGFDGISYTEEGNKTIAAFDSNQIKSAIGNVGTFSGKTGNIRFSKGVAAKQAPTFTVPEFGIARKAQQKLQDNFNRIKQIQEAITKQGGKVAPTSDVRAAEERFWGKAGARTSEFQHAVKNLISAISKANIDLGDMEEYLYARHAGERNQYIRTNVDANNMSGSGITDAKAAQIMQEMEAKHKGIDKLADRFDAITAETRELQYQSGLISKETFDQWGQYKHYAPLKGFADESLDKEFSSMGKNIGKGFDVRGAESKKAGGRTTLATALIENIYQQRLQAIVRGGKNEIGAALFNLVQENPNSDLWQINAIARSKGTKNGEALLRFDTQQERDDYLDDMGIKTAQLGYDGTVYTAQFAAPVGVITSYVQQAPNTIATKIGGKTVFIKIKDEALLEQLQRAGITSDLGALEGVAIAQNMLKRFYTSLNPEFTAINFMRDLMTAFIAMPRETGRFVDSAKFLKNMTVIGSTWKYAFGKQDAKLSPEMKDLLNRYLENGGTTGFMDFQDLEKTTKSINNMWLDARHAKDAGLMDKAKTMSRLAWDRTAGMVERANESLEMATRLAAFKTAIESGKSDREAGSIAKNITVNFNRKGDWARGMDLPFMFFNPAIQGTVRVAQLASDKKSVALLGGLVMLGLMTALISGGDEDEEKNSKWDLIPDENKMKTLPFLGLAIDGGFGQIQMPYGVNFFTNIGYALGDVYRYYKSNGSRGKSPEEAAEFTMKAMALHLNAFGGMQIFEGGLSSVQAFSPAMVDPMIQIGGNVNWKGGAMRPEDQYNKGKNDATPDSQKFFAGQEDNPETRITGWLSRMTGGDGVKSGFIEVAPSSLNAVMSATFGGVWSMGKAASSATNKALDPNQRVEAKDVPVVRKMVGGVTSGMYSTAYREKADEVKGLMSQYDNYIKDGRFAEAKAFYDDNVKAFEVGNKVKGFDKQFKTLRTHRNLAFASKSLSDADRQKRLTENKKQVEDLLKKAVKTVE